MRGVRKNFAVHNRIIGESARSAADASTPKSAPPSSSSRDVLVTGPGTRYRPGNSSVRQGLEVTVPLDGSSVVTDSALSPERKPRRRGKRRSAVEAAARATAQKAVKEILLCTLGDWELSGAVQGHWGREVAS